MSLKIDSPELNDLKNIYTEFMKMPVSGLTFDLIKLKTQINSAAITFWIDKLKAMNIIEHTVDAKGMIEEDQYRVTSNHLREYLRSIE